MRAQTLADVLQQGKSGFPDSNGVAHVAIEGDLAGDALRITRREHRTGIDTPSVSAKQAAILAEEFAKQRIGEGCQLADGTNPDPFEAEHRRRPAPGQLCQR